MQTLETPTDSPRFGWSPQPLKISVEKLNAKLTEHLRDPKTPRPVANGILATIWLLNVEAFRSQEEELMVAGTFNSAEGGHRAMMAGLIADGEGIVFAISEQGMTEVANGASPADIEATLDSLRTAFFCEHGPKNSEKTNALIEGLFDVAPAGN